MKKISILFLFLFFYCIASAKEITSVGTDINGIKFRIDKRIELFYTVAYLSNYPFLNGLDIEYKDKLERYFESYRTHETIERFRDIFFNVFDSVDSPIFFMLNMDDELNFITELKYVKSAEHAETFRQILKAFAKDSRFDTFYEENTDLYRIILSTIEFNFTDFKTKSMLEEYYGTVDNKEFVIILNLLGDGNFGPLITTSDGTTGYCVIEPNTAFGNIPGFPPSRAFYGLTFHEFSHTYITPLIKKYEKEINNYVYLLEPIKDSMTGQFYPMWSTVVNEHITRAVTCRLAARQYGEKSAELTEYRMEVGRRFIYVPPLIEKLKVYENNRDKYPTFEDFFPELISVFAEITSQDIEEYQQMTENFRKPEVSAIPVFAEIMGGNEQDIVFILPTAEEDTENAVKLIEFIKTFHDECFSSTELISDKEALNRDLSDKNIVVLGTPWGNLFLKEYIHILPVSIEPDKIVAGKEYKGDNYQFLTGWVNPFNTNKGMAIYTAQKPENLIDINTILPSKGFTIARDYKPIKRGEYFNGSQIWIMDN